MQYYVLDSSYADDHLEYARILRTPRDDARDVAEILTAIQSYYEEMEGTSKTPEMDDLVDVLVKRFGFKEVDKELRLMQLNEILNYMADTIDAAYEEFDFDEDYWIYLDRQGAGDALCSGMEPLELYKKWLTPLIKGDIKKMSAEA